MEKIIDAPYFKLAEPYFVGHQGEGSTQGNISVFVRFTVCNLACSFCDSKFSWKKGEIEEFKCSVDELIKKINEVGHVVFTGGEPLLVKNALDIRYILSQVNNNVTAEIETNGTINKIGRESVLNYFDQFVDILKFNISPKLNIEQENGQNTEPKLLHSMVSSDFNYNVKFLFENKDDLKLISEWQIKYNIPNENMWVQPCGTLTNTIIPIIRDNYDDIINYGWNLSHRTHIFIWEDKKGV